MASETHGDAGRPELPAATNLRHRAHLDGLRTVAVYLVVAFHSGLGLVAGGYIGVDIFFVLSGYLVTSILVRGLSSVGHIGLRRFYARRVRRILPAAFLYVANWNFIRQSTWPTCDAVVGGAITRIDTNHFTKTFARNLADRVGALIPR